MTCVLVHEWHVISTTYLPTGPVEGIHNLTHLGEGGGAEPCPGVFGLKGTDC